jgi:hypothetical protein
MRRLRRLSGAELVQVLRRYNYHRHERNDT